MKTRSIKEIMCEDDVSYEEAVDIYADESDYIYEYIKDQKMFEGEK